MKQQSSNKNNNSWKTRPRFAKTGYSLHADRFLYAGKEGIRSFKIPLKNKNQVIFQDFAKKIQHDYISQIGLVNFVDWFENNNEQFYSFADFWLDSLRAGVIFTHKDSETKSLISRINGKDLKFNKFKNNIEDKYNVLSEIVNVKSLYEFFLSNKRKGKKTDKEFFNSVRNQLFPDFKKENNDDVDYWTEKFYKIKNSEKREYAKKFVGFDIFSEVDYDHNFFIHHELEFTKNLSAKELVVKYKKFIELNSDLYQGKDTLEKLKMVFGFFNNHGAFSKYFNATLNAFRNKDHTIKEQIVNASPYWKKNQEELEKRLLFLQKCSNEVSFTELAKPHEYISGFGGKFESWVSNYLRQEQEIKNQLFGYLQKDKNGNVTDKFTAGHLQELDLIIKNKNFSVNGNAVISNDSALLAKDCKKLIEEMSQDIDDTKLVLYRQLVGELRTQLNVGYQEAYPELEGKTEQDKKKDEMTKRADKKYPTLFRDIKLVPNFLGDTKRKAYKKFIKSADIVHQGLAFIDLIDQQITKIVSYRFKSDAELVQFTERQFETLRRKYYVMNNTRFQHIIGGLIKSVGFLGLEKKEGGKVVSFSDPTFNLERIFLQKDGRFENEGYYTFSTNKYSFNQRKTKIILDIDKNNSVHILQEIISKLKPRWSEIVATNDFGEMIDAIEMEKVRLGVIVAIYDQHNFLIDKKTINKELFESAHAYLEFQDNPKMLSGTSLGRFLQAMICSEIKGALNKMSRKEYVERYIAQPMKSEENYPLAVSGDGKICWHIVDKKLIKRKDGFAVKIKTGKDFAGKADSYREYFVNSENLFDLVSSKYHLQFLTKTLGDRKNSWWARKDIYLGLSSYSFIFEQKVVLNWNVENKKLDVIRGVEKYNNNVYVSIPFVLKPQKAKIDLEKRTCYMGIDVGEYGLAWTILDVDLKNKKVNKILKQGFFYEPLTHKVRNYVNTIKENQVGGTFGIPDSKLARLRENAITSLRNQVHDIAMRYNARPVYEFEISNFETGSNKVKVIYDSVKRADVGRGGNDAEKAEADLVWGKRGKNFGSQIGAYATSYMCTKCKNSPYFDFESGKITKEKLSNTKKLTRPSLEDFLDKYPKYKEEKVLQKIGNKDGVWKNMRGNTAIYVCQNCDHVSDADIQASYWISMKKIMRDMYDPKNNNTENQSFDSQHARKTKKADELKRLFENHNNKVDNTVEIDFLMGYLN